MKYGLALMAAACSPSVDAPADSNVEAVSIAGTEAMSVYRDTIPDCVDCEIRLDSVAILGSRLDPIIMQNLPLVAADSKQRFYAATPYRERQDVVLYSQGGEFVRPVGAQGRGPGEFVRVMALTVGPGDSLYVVHDRNVVSVFDSAGEYVRGGAVPTPFMERVIALDNGNLISFSQLQTPSLYGIPFHVVDSEGNILRSIGTPNIANFGNMLLRTISAGSDGRLWVAESVNYRIEVMDSLGSIHRVLAVQPPDSWNLQMYIDRAAAIKVRERSTKTIVRSDMLKHRPATMPLPPRPAITGMAEDGEVLWVTIAVPAVGWDTIRVKWDRSTTELVQQPEMRQLLYRTAIDAVDLETGNLVARHYLDGYAFLDPHGFIFRPHVGADGFISVKVIVPRLQQP
ncbi:MAG: 6-bladed beta-propeller [Gemmatimonadota bacterium]